MSVVRNKYYAKTLFETPVLVELHTLYVNNDHNNIGLMLYETFLLKKMLNDNCFQIFEVNVHYSIHSSLVTNITLS